jgi:hypothetical protein
VIASNPHHRLFPQRPAQGHAKPVKAIGPRGKVFGVFPHADQAAAALGIWRNAIVSALRKGNRAAGYYWRYVGVPDELQPLNNRLRSDHGTRPPIPDRFLPRAPEPVRPQSARAVVYQGRNLDYSTRAREPIIERTPADFERGRFDKARAYNPALTWEGWITVAGKKRGRPPRRDSGAAKGVGT